MLRRYPCHSLAVAALLVAIAAFAVPAVAAHKTRTIPVGDFYFVKDTNHTPTVHVASGTLMRWHFVGLEDHNVTVEKGPAKFHCNSCQSPGAGPAPKSSGIRPPPARAR